MPPVSLVLGELEERFQEIIAEAHLIIEKTSSIETEVRVDRYADMRYSGQNSELVVSLPEQEINTVNLAAFADRFQDAYEHNFGRSLTGIPVDVVNIRVTLSAEI